MDDTTIRISCAQNGYVVEVEDPDIKKDNNDRNMSLNKGGKMTPWKDPHVKFTFATKAEVSKFISDNIEKLFSDDDDSSYSTTFDVAASKSKGEK